MAINISNNDPRIHYAATAGQTLFTIPFSIFDDNDLLVYVNDVLKSITSDYTIANSEVTLLSAASLNDKIALTRNVPIERTTDLASSYSANAIDDQLDRIVSQIADLDDKADRTIQISDSELAPSMLLTADRKGKVLAFNATTGAVEAGPTSNDIATIATNIAEILAADDEAAAAAASATAAASSATAAQTAETAAELAETNAETAAALATTNGAAQVTLATTQANNAAGSATTATAQAVIATTKATEAATSATNAATSETNAATSETNAASSATSAQASKDAALAALDSFDDRYLGQKAADPTVDNDGDALVSGALYFDTTNGVMKVYDGSLWVAAYASLSGAVLQANNLSDLANVVTSRTNLGLGSAATTDSTAYATAAQGALADSATQPSDLGTAATTAASDYATAAQGVKADASVQATATTGQANLPSGTTAQRTAGPIAGAMRFNSTDTSFEGYNGTEWGSIGGGAADGIFYENEQNVTANYTIAASKNAMTTGPITIGAGVSVTIETGARWVVL